MSVAEAVAPPITAAFLLDTLAPSWRFVASIARRGKKGF
jgi:hypothetical protein